MKKCAKCGGSMKYQKGGSTMKTTVGSATPKGQIYGIPQTGPTGPNKQGIDTMKKGGSKVTAVKHSCPPGTVRSATGGCVSQRPVPKAQLGTIVKGIKALGKGFSRVNKAPGGTTAIGGTLAAGIAAAAKNNKKTVIKKKK